MAFACMHMIYFSHILLHYFVQLRFANLKKGGIAPHHGMLVVNIPKG